jgi:cellulose synthase/poly-beta-1,6-N-acetylglucosamine synthase-like glycosyltransferase
LKKSNTDVLALRQLSKFTVGICACDKADHLPDLIRLIESEQFSDDYVLARIVVVASGCPGASLSPLRDLVKLDSRLLFIEEKSRSGKANAINVIIKNAVGEYLIFINSDAMPASGSISKLLQKIGNRNEQIGVVSACPSFDGCSSVTSMVEELMWSVHNECSLRLNHMNESNHGSDEMMVVRTELLRTLPQGLVNDGAYIAGRAKLLGYSIKFCADAPVGISVPSRCVDLIRQRRRIIFGHIQIWRLTGRSPKTVESLLLRTPLFSLGLVSRSIGRNPKLLKIIPLAFVSEAISVLLALIDSITSTTEHSVWKRYEN